MMDTQGPAIRTGDLPIPLELKPGDIFEFTVKGAQSEEEKSVDVNYPNLVKDIHEGDTVLVDRRGHPPAGAAEAASADALRGADGGGTQFPSSYQPAGR
jgi:hypothetical protein